MDAWKGRVEGGDLGGEFLMGSEVGLRLGRGFGGGVGWWGGEGCRWTCRGFEACLAEVDGSFGGGLAGLGEGLGLSDEVADAGCEGIKADG